VSSAGPGLREREQQAIREAFAGLERDVPVRLVLGPEEAPVSVIVAGRDIDFGAETRSLLEQVAGLSDRVMLTVEETAERGRWPEITIGDGLRYHGLPWGYELSSLVGAIAEAGKPASSLSEDSLAALATLRRPVAIEVYVTPT
jgi:alkyl hydroperoxide reductase subunit AhpF